MENKTNKFYEKWVRSRRNIREYDINKAFKNIPEKYFSNALEIGSGDGFQSGLLIKYCKSLVCTEINEERFDKSLLKQENGLRFMAADAENLPFPDNSFDLIFSSNMLEHVKDKKKSLSEMKRVLKNDGIMVHIIPNRLMKLFNFIFYYPFAIRIILNKEARKIAFAKIKDDSKRCNIKSKDVSVFRKMLPPIHGEDKNHFSEYINFGKNCWEKLFKENGVVVIKVLKMSLSSSYRFGLDNARRILQNMGLCTSFAYITVKESHKSEAEIYFV